MKKKAEVIIYIVTKLELGGAQKVCLSLFNGVQKSDKTTYLISGSEGILTNLVHNKENVILLDSLKREVSWWSFVNEIRTFFSLVRQLKTIKRKHPNEKVIVHTHSTKAGLVGRWAAFFARIPFRVHTVHGYGFHEHQNYIVWFCVYFLELITNFITTHFVCVSSADAHRGEKLFPRFKRKYSLIRAGVNWDQFYTPARETTIEQNQFVFGTISCFKPQKNLGDLIQAFQLVYNNNPHVRLEIIGDGVLRTELEKLIYQYQLQDVVTLHGWQQSTETIMQNWHAFVLSSLWEGLPCSVIEARLLRLPIISYNTGGISEVVVHGKNGFLYPQKKWLKLAYGMLELSTNYELYEKLRTYEDNLTEFSNGHMIDNHVHLYEKLVK